MDYNFIKLLHIVAVVIFLGNVFTGFFWMHIAIKSGSFQVIAHTINGVIKSDRYFTVPGVLFITAFGFWAAIKGHFPILGTGWILWSLIFFTLSGMAFMLKVVPLQNEMKIMTEDETTFNEEIFLKRYASWRIWGAIAIITPFIAMIMMTLKWPV